MKVLLLFLDGVGIGPADPDRNPFLRARLPVLRELLGGPPPTLDRPAVAGDRAAAFPLDATLGVEGTPQSGTGHTALLTGVNAAARFGRHFGPWVPVSLRPLLEEENVLRAALDRGRTAAFANAYPEGWPGPRRGRWLGGMPMAARAAGLVTRHAEALGRGEAVASGIVNRGWREVLGHAELPEPSAADAGRTLARIAAGADLTLFAHYATDHAGHQGDMAGAVEALELVDAFLGGLAEGLPDDVLLLMTSDHGNIEDVTTGHTRNPALGLVLGDAARRRAEPLASITDVRDAVLGWLEE